MTHALSNIINAHIKYEGRRLHNENIFFFKLNEQWKGLGKFFNLSKAWAMKPTLGASKCIKCYLSSSQYSDEHVGIPCLR